MASVLAHRGPDGEGIALLGSTGLAHRRLAIIDLSTGDQPMYNEDRSLCLVFNGEIYNFKALRKDLKNKGHRFSSHSDTEVILHLYEDEGVRCLERLRGMFAFALWDSNRRRLFLARDRAGKKPLYHCVHDGAFYFASEMKSLLTVPGMPRKLRPRGLHDFLTYQYVPPPDTIFEGIHKLPHGHYLLEEEGVPKLHRYWQLDYGPKWEVDEAEAISRCEDLIDESVRLRLESDVPLGVFLSGGIDSSLVVAMMRRHISGPLRTFSIGFEHEDYNELPHARQVAERYETDHEEFIVQADATAVLPRLAWHFDEPFADMAALPTFYLSEMTRRHVTVALNGDGGDELFAGYPRHMGQGLMRFGKWEYLPAPLRRYAFAPCFRGLQTLFPKPWLFSKLRFANEMSLADLDYRAVVAVTVFRNWMKERLYSPEFAAQVDGLDSLEWALTHHQGDSLTDSLDRILNTDTMTYLPECLLPKVDRTSMAVGLEGRSPLLDQELMAYAARLPSKLKTGPGKTKYLLRRIAESHLPAEIVWRRKQGFGMPLHVWLRGPLRGLSRELLLSDRSIGRGFFRREEVKTLLRENEVGVSNHGFRIWALMCLEVWCRTFLDPHNVTSGPIVF